MESPPATPTPPAARSPLKWAASARGLSLAVTLGVMALQAAGALEAPERALMNLRLWLRGPRTPPAEVVIVAIDEAALARYGGLPWDRRVYASMLDRLTRDHARAVGLDVAFNEPARERAQDAALGLAIARNAHVVLPSYRALAGREGTVLYPPLPALARGAAGVGLVQFSTAAENVIFRYDPQQREGDQLIPTFASALARVAGHAVDSRFSGYLDPLGPARRFATLSFAEAMDAPAGTYRDRVVLIGATARGLPDTNFAWAFPANGPISGVELHATAFANLASNGLLRRLPGWLVAIGLLALGLGPGAFLIRPPIRRRWHPTFALVGLAAAIAVASQLALALSWWIEFTAPLVLLTTCHVVGLGWREMLLLAEQNRLLDRYARDLHREARGERQRIDGELHDEAQQLVIALQRELRRSLKRLPADMQPVAEPVQAASELAQQLFDEILRVRRDLVPRQLENAGLVAALETLAGEVRTRHPELEIRLECEDLDERLAPDQEAELYWLIKEALNNALKHAQARRMVIGLARDAHVLRIRFTDDGAGFAVPDYHIEPAGVEHSGLHRMWLRARAWGGDLEVRSQPGRGTELVARVPLKGAHS